MPPITVVKLTGKKNALKRLKLNRLKKVKSYKKVINKLNLKNINSNLTLKKKKFRIKKYLKVITQRIKSLKKTPSNFTSQEKLMEKREKIKKVRIIRRKLRKYLVKTKKLLTKTSKKLSIILNTKCKYLKFKLLHYKKRRKKRFLKSKLLRERPKYKFKLNRNWRMLLRKRKLRKKKLINMKANHYFQTKAN